MGTVTTAGPDGKVIPLEDVENINVIALLMNKDHQEEEEDIYHTVQFMNLKKYSDKLGTGFQNCLLMLKLLKLKKIHHQVCI
jgi:hypothetical protein